MSKNEIGLSSGDFDLLEVLRQGPEVWNQWREDNPDAQIVLIGANLIGANLEGADLNLANLSDANLSRANLSRANLSGANLSGANLSSVFMSGNFLMSIKLSGADLNGADLSKADLNGADLKGTDLSGVDLSGANLNGADLSEADLSRAILIKANLSGANLEGADLSHAKLGLINEAKYRFPYKFYPNRSSYRKFNTYQKFQISVYDPEIKSTDLKKLQSAIDSFAEASGYKEVTLISERFGSWFRKVRYKIARLISQEVQEEAIRAGKEFYQTGKASTLNYLEKTGVESTKQIAEATAEILKAVENLDDVVLLLGKLIVMKYTNEDGRSKTYVKTISSDLQLKLESTPQLLDSPQAIINFLKSQEELPPAIEDRKTLPATPKPLK